MHVATTASRRSRTLGSSTASDNPPWGASNGGESVNVFAQRGLEAIGYSGDGMIVIADDPGIAWPKEVLANVQEFVLSQEFVVQRLMPEAHSYHLDDAPDLRSCNLIIRSLASGKREVASEKSGPPGVPKLLWTWESSLGSLRSRKSSHRRRHSSRRRGIRP